jgi:predicted Rossmann fold flavoprotein
MSSSIDHYDLWTRTTVSKAVDLSSILSRAAIKYIKTQSNLVVFFDIKTMKIISIIWAWPAGLMTAVTILENSFFCHTDEGSICSNDSTAGQIPHTSEWQKNMDFQIHIFEKNQSPWKKLLISGGGRCNITTGITDKKILETKYTRGWHFIKKAIGKFWPAKTYEWFENHGIELKTETDNRVFPVSDDGSEVLEVFEKIFAKYRNRIFFHYWEWVSGVSFLSSAWADPFENQIWENNSQNHFSEWKSDSSAMLRNDKEKIIYQITTAKWVYTSDMLVITTGGNAYSHTGSTGDGYAFARSLGHTITQLGPSLSSFLTREDWTHELSGLAFENARIGTLNWPLLLTHFGISGPLAFMHSSQIAWDDIDKNIPKMIRLSPLDSMRYEDWEIFLKGEFSQHPKKLITSILSEKLPRRFVDAFVTEFFSNISNTFAASISRTDRERISDLFGNGIPMSLIWRRPGDEFVTAGGVNTDEIDPETMESKIQKNLYFAGEVLNVDGYTGGFSLQICWSSGYVVGKEISKLLK